MASLTLSLDFDTNSRHHSDAVPGVMAEAERRPTPSGEPYTESNIDPARSKENVHWFNPRFGERDSNSPALLDDAIQELSTKKKAPKSSAVLMRGLIYKASPDFFFPKIREEAWSQNMIDDPRLYEQRGPIDQVALKNFTETAFKHCAEAVGGEQNILSFHVHVDEASPHIHFLTIPMVTNESGTRLCNREFIFGNCDRKSELRERGEKFVADARDYFRNCATADGTCLKNAELSKASRDKSTLKHGLYTAPDQIQKTLEADEQRQRMAADRLRDSKRELEQERDLPTDSSYSSQVELNDRDTWPDVFNGNKIEPQKLVDSWNEDRKVIAKLQGYIDTQKKELAEARSEALHQKIRADAAEAKASNHMKYSREIANQLRESISCEDILRLEGFQFVEHESKEFQYATWKAPEELGGKVKVTGQKWYDWHTQKGGGGPFDLYMHLRKCDFKTAFEELYNHFGDDKLAQAAMSRPEYARVAVKAVMEHWDSESPKPPELPTQGNNSLMKTFLMKLGIKPDQAQEMARHVLAKGQAYIDKRSNVVVPREGGGYFLNGTVDMGWKQTRGTQRQGCKSCVLTTPQTKPGAPLALCEGIKDAMAYLALHPEHEAAVIGGSAHAWPTPKPGQTIRIACDNDKQGKAHAEKIREQYPEHKIEEAYPPVVDESCPEDFRRNPKDWAAYLKDFKPLEEARKIEEQRLEEQRRLEETQRLEEQRREQYSLNQAPRAPRPGQ